MSTEVDLLREAADTMLERAMAATPGPWGVANDTHVVRGLEVTGRGSYTCIQSVADMTDFYDRPDWGSDDYIEVDPEDDANHIVAIGDPSVAMTVANWLEDAAEALEVRISLDQQPLHGGFIGHALATARAYLRRAA